MAVLTLDDAHLDEIQARAAAIKPGRTVLSLIAWVLYYAGWLAAKLMTVVIWRSFRFTVAAVATGWKEASGPSKRDIIAQQAALIKDMQMRLSRFDG